MTPTPKRWNIQPKMPDDHYTRFPGLSRILAQILYNRGVTNQAEVDRFLECGIRFDDPFQMLGIPEAVERIRAAIKAGEYITVYGDFDADGVTATVLLVETLEALGARVSKYIPHRVDEGYGLHMSAMDSIAAAGTRLVISVDCGIRAVEEVAYASALGMDVIVTDHHAIGRREGVQILPVALAVINPRQEGESYPFHELAGVGIAFKLAQALLRAEHDAPLAHNQCRLTEVDLLDLVALGTVADVAPLLNENRSLVQRGLLELNRPRRRGVQAMLDEARLQPDRVDAGAIGYVLGPRLNAAGRLASAELSYELLRTSNDCKARALAAELGRLNRERQDLTHKRVLDAKDQIERAGGERYVHFVCGPDFNPGIVGLVASRLTEELYRPALVAQQDEDTTHGSARSIPEFDITAALDECRDLLVKYGGHAMAAGFAVKNERLPELQARLEGLASQKLAGKDLQPSLEIDINVPLSSLNWALQTMLLKLEPCGMANPQPVFASYGLEVVKKRKVGGEGQHLKLVVRQKSATGPAQCQEWDAIAFRQGDWLDCLPERVDLAYTLEHDEFNGKPRLQLRVKDIRPAGDCEQLPLLEPGH